MKILITGEKVFVFLGVNRKKTLKDVHTMKPIRRYDGEHDICETLFLSPNGNIIYIIDCGEIEGDIVLQIESIDLV